MLLVCHLVQQSPAHYQSALYHFVTDFVGQKESNEFPERVICNKTFPGNRLKESFHRFLRSETHLFL